MGSARQEQKKNATIVSGFVNLVCEGGSLTEPTLAQLFVAGAEWLDASSPVGCHAKCFGMVGPTCMNIRHRVDAVRGTFDSAIQG
jgi:hypothetical protein